jgi:hypothetical protein
LESEAISPCTYTSIPCVYTDAAFVPFPSNVSSAESILKADSINTGSLVINTGSKPVWSTLYYPEDVALDSENPVVSGDSAFKTGRTTGTTSGTIDSICVDITTSSSHKLCQTSVIGDDGDFIDSGDSGSAVVGSILGSESFSYTFPYSYKATLLGLANSSSSTHAYFTPIDAIVKEFGELDSI